MLCGCAQCDRLVLSTGESVETLYYHECRMPNEVMTEMWIDFPSRRLRVKSNVEKFSPRDGPLRSGETHPALSSPTATSALGDMLPPVRACAEITVERNIRSSAIQR